MISTTAYPTGSTLRVLRVTAQAWNLVFQWPPRPALRWRWAV